MKSEQAMARVTSNERRKEKEKEAQQKIAEQNNAAANADIIANLTACLEKSKSENKVSRVSLDQARQKIHTQDETIAELNQCIKSVESVVITLDRCLIYQNEIRHQLLKLKKVNASRVAPADGICHQDEIRRLREELEQSAAQDSGRCQQLHDQAATIVRLEGELATAKASAPRFAIGDTSVIGPNPKGAIHKDHVGEEVEVKSLGYYVAYSAGLTWISAESLTPAPEAPAVPVEVWHDCTMETAREKFVQGARVRLRGTWEDDGWLRIDGGCVVDECGNSVSEAAGQLFTERDGWQWSEWVAK